MRSSRRRRTGAVAVPSGKGTFLSRRLLGTEYARHGNAVAFNVYEGGRRLNTAPIVKSTTYQDNSRGTGSCSIRAVVNGRESRPSSALTFAMGPGSYTQVGGNVANDPVPAAVSGSMAIGGYRNDDNVTVYDLDSDGRAEVLVHTADGTTCADGSKVTADSTANQFVSVIGGATGTERTRQPVPDDLVADGPSGGHFGIARLDGEHPGLVTKLVTRVGARRGAFRAFFQTLDFNGRDLTRRWTYAVPAASGATGFHRIRTVDVDQDGRDEIADHTALRLFTTTEPTRTHVHTLAQNPAYRLGWTVRGYLQSTCTDYYLGTETRRVPRPSITAHITTTPGAVS